MIGSRKTARNQSTRLTRFWGRLSCIVICSPRYEMVGPPKGDCPCGGRMKETTLSLPELAMIGGTRAALGAGLGLLLAGKISEEQRRAAGTALLFVGIVSTIPLALEVRGKSWR